MRVRTIHETKNITNEEINNQNEQIKQLTQNIITVVLHNLTATISGCCLSKFVDIDMKILSFYYQF